MKINEIIQEGKLGNGAKHSTPDMQTYPALNNNNSPYAAYRFGLALAGSPDFDEPMDKHGPIGGDFTTIGYSDADKEILAAINNPQELVQKIVFNLKPIQIENQELRDRLNSRLLDLIKEAA